MCFLTKQKSVEEIVAQNSIGMTDAQRAEYWYELSQSIFSIVGKTFDPTIIEISPDEWIKAMQAQYPTLTDIKIADSKFYATTLTDLQRILTLDWTNLVPYVAEKSDCDKFATRLYSHLCDYYGITDIVPIWGDTTQGYHGFEGGVLRDNGLWIARLVEPQRDSIFIEEGPLGQYVPRQVAEELGIKKL